MPSVVTHHRKRAHAVTGDLVTLSHPHDALDTAFSSHVDVVYAGVTHQVLSLGGRAGIDFTHTTGEFTVGGLRGYLIEAIDLVQTQGSHRFQAVVESDSGILTTYSYLGAAELLELIGALQPVPTALGMVVTPTDDVEIVTTAKVALATSYGLLECSPLTTEVNDLLPKWSGSTVANGELFGGHLGDEAPFLTLVTDSVRALLMVNDPDKVDQATSFMSDLDVRWAA